MGQIKNIKLHIVTDIKDCCKKSNQRNQGLSPHSKKKRCKICQDHEEERQHSQVQSAMQSILVHVESQRQREGCQVETVAPTWIVGQGYWKIIEIDLVTACSKFVMEHYICAFVGDSEEIIRAQ